MIDLKDIKNMNWIIYFCLKEENIESIIMKVFVNKVKCKFFDLMWISECVDFYAVVLG